MRIWNWLFGEIEVEVRGLALERFMNQMNRSGIRILGSRVTSEGILVRIKPRDFQRLHEIVRKRSCRVKIVKKIGLPFLFSRLCRRKMFLAGLALALLTVYFLSSYVWFIEVKGLVGVDEEEINQILQENGIYRGQRRAKVSLEDLEAAIIDHPRIVWAEASFTGTKLVILLVEKKVIEEEPGSHNLIAARDGIITEVILLQGQQVVQEGETVKRGDLLIRGRENGKRVMARGIVRAKVWYEGRGSQPLKVRNFLLTGAKKWGYTLKMGTRDFHIWGVRDPGFDKYRLQRDVKSFTFWRNLNFPIELIKENFLEVKEQNVSLDSETAFLLAEEEAYRQLIHLIPFDGKIIRVKVMQREIVNRRAVVRVLLEVEEEIAQEQGRKGDNS